MRRVLIVIPSLEQGGGQKFVMDLAKGIDREKFQVRVLVYYQKSGSVFDRFAEEHHIDTVYLSKKVGLDWSFFKQVRRAVKDFDPHVIHTHLDSMLYLLPVYKRRQIKLHTVHTLAEKENVGLQRLVRTMAYKWRGVTPVGISHTVQESIAQTHKIKKDRIPVVYNGVDCARYALPHTASEQLRLVTVGNIYQVKNYAFLVDCFAGVCQNADHLRLTIVGDGVLRAELEAQIRRLGLEGKVVITGLVSDVERYLAEADVYVASSLFEGLPISILEAMAAGLPVISTRVGGVPDVVKHGVNGTLVPLGDKEAYVAALKEMVEDPAKREAYSMASQALSLQYDETRTVEGYQALYRA